MKKSDLKSGMVVEYRDGRRRLVIWMEEMKKLVFVGEDGWQGDESYNDDLTVQNYQELDIVKVYQAVQGYNFNKMLNVGQDELIWSREDDSKEITAEEAFRILEKHYGCRVKIMKE